MINKKSLNISLRNMILKEYSSKIKSFLKEDYEILLDMPIHENNFHLSISELYDQLQFINIKCIESNTLFKLIFKDKLKSNVYKEYIKYSITSKKILKELDDQDKLKFLINDTKYTHYKNIINELTNPCFDWQLKCINTNNNFILLENVSMYRRLVDKPNHNITLLLHLMLKDIKSKKLLMKLDLGDCRINNKLIFDHQLQFNYSFRCNNIMYLPDELNNDIEYVINANNDEYNSVNELVQNSSKYPKLKKLTLEDTFHLIGNKIETLELSNKNQIKDIFENIFN